MKSGIEAKVKEIIDSEMDVSDVTYVPDLENPKLTFGNTGLRFEATTLFIDMRGSTKTLNKHNRRSVAKIHKAYFHTIVTIVKSLSGEVRSFNGDGMLCFFQGTTKQTLTNAVIAAMKIKYMLNSDDSKVKKSLEKYSPVDFGIGIDDGKIICSKVGISGTNNRDLVWIGNAVNKSVKIGDTRSSPEHIGISSFVYSNLLDSAKYHISKDHWGNDVKTDMWTLDYINYNDQTEAYYKTRYHWIVS
ncbi:guanylate cyclase [Pseudomonas tohonis]|uniref:Guanylate cyclase n=1 Tax=Pseudomonas tohonis TaxID=2725477 RepID=A0A6J4EA45_9PSED|nr:adenylate/guanylate cyclase domain-containing protein [Pseudomonas tohonis]BCG26126.1 guanylate cyclase [Pseudomonas tohonis]GJN51143.1 guanylate cyclase [Pseudomonas tohonis]